MWKPSFRWDEEGSLCHAIFHGDFLHGLSGEPRLKRTDCGRIAAKDFIGECVNLIDGEFHAKYFTWIFRSLDTKRTWV